MKTERTLQNFIIMIYLHKRKEHYKVDIRINEQICPFTKLQNNVQKSVPLLDTSII